MPLPTSFFQLRETIYNFSQKELAPYADQIDKENGWPKMRVRVLCRFFPSFHIFLNVCDIDLFWCEVLFFLLPFVGMVC